MCAADTIHRAPTKRGITYKNRPNGKQQIWNVSVILQPHRDHNLEEEVAVGPMWI